ncbi:hypothetical protein Q5P01_014860 [Channa striata]|uniref:Uncharacterized protein n=1 Tax=Channa striata TaxID=64152 RepID=A0AA88MJ23_CHASR|nr:hypothetical protein Q5P01_014860 [Channa striata]
MASGYKRPLTAYNGTFDASRAQLFDTALSEASYPIRQTRYKSFGQNKARKPNSHVVKGEALSKCSWILTCSHLGCLLRPW